MTQEIDARAQAELPSPDSAFLERLVEKLGGKADAAVVYGQPVERDGVTVIPVARVRWLFGGGAGAGTGPEGRGGGFGSGGGVTASPVGYIELRDGAAAFKPIGSPAQILQAVVPIVLAGGLTATLVLRAVGRLIAGIRGKR